MSVERRLRRTLTKERDICYLFRSRIHIDEIVNPSNLIHLQNAIDRLVDCLRYRNVQYLKDNQLR